MVAGDAKIDNKKFKMTFGLKARMLTPEEVVEYTNHEIGGVCPFGISREDVMIYLDKSLERFNTVFPACGSANSAIEISCKELERLCRVENWVDVCNY